MSQITKEPLIKNRLNPDAFSIQISNRVPHEFFVTSGVGESDITIHAGSYHLALRDANIEHLNIMTYSSILPEIAKKVECDPKRIPHGAVLETIMAEKSVRKGERATAAIIWGWLVNKKTGKRYGGLVCEYNGNGTVEEAEKSLRASLNELYANGYSDAYSLDEANINFRAETLVPKKNFGTALVALGFVSHQIPVERIKLVS